MNPRTRRRALAASIAVFLTLLLSACVPPVVSGALGVEKESELRPPASTPAPAPSPSSASSAASAPSLSRESAAFFAALTSFERYLGVVDAIGADGGADAARIDPYAAPNHRGNLVVAFEGMHNEGIRTTGSVVLADESLADESLAGYREYPGDGQAVWIRACLDLSGTRVLDVAGVDVTPHARQDRVPYDVVLSTRKSPDGHFLVESSRSLPDLAPC